MKLITSFMIWFNLYLINCADNDTSKGIRLKLFRQKTPREQLLNAPKHLEKYGIRSDWLFKKPKPTIDSIALYRFLDNEFYAKIVVGHPGQTMNVALDTAWSLTWLLSAKCDIFKTIGCWFHNRYNHDVSTSYKENGTVYVANEGTYNISGFYSYENISMAHSNVTDFSFVEMTNVPFLFALSKQDGVLGLALRDDKASYNPFFYALHQQGKIKNLIFSIYLNRDTHSAHGGNVMLGFFDKKHIHQTRYPNGSVIYDEIAYVNVDPGQYWKFGVDNISMYMDPNKPTVLCSQGCKAIVDSSSNGIQGPNDQIQKILKQIQATKLFYNKWRVDCEKINSFPKVSFNFGGKPFVLNGKDYVIKMSFQSFTLCLSAFSPADTPGVQGSWVLGGAFLSKYYSIYDLDEKKIGFVRAA